MTVGSRSFLASALRVVSVDTGDDSVHADELGV